MFDIISDMHVEMNEAWSETDRYDGVSSIYPWHLQKQSDILLIIGDCANDPLTTAAVLDEAQQFYEHVLFTDGNHEHYTYHRKRSPWATVGHNNRFLQSFADANPRIQFLNASEFQIDDTLFIGANGWYDWTAHSWTTRGQQMEMWKRESNDSRMIRFDKGGFPDKMARYQANALREMVIRAQTNDDVRHIAVMTHTIPHRKGMVADNHPWGHLNGSYLNAFMEQVWMADEAGKIGFWGFGHTHYHYDFDDNGIRFVNNSRGYFDHRAKKKFPGIKQIDLSADLPKSVFGEIED